MNWFKKSSKSINKCANDNADWWVQYMMEENISKETRKREQSQSSFIGHTAPQNSYQWKRLNRPNFLYAETRMHTQGSMFQEL